MAKPSPSRSLVPGSRHQTARGHDMRAKVPQVRNANGYSKVRFTIDLHAGTVTCPAHHSYTSKSDMSRNRVA
jgi:hypothetical protein